MCSMNVRRRMVVCEYSITSAYLQLYLQTNINITSYYSATPFTPGPGDGASTATVSQKTPIYVVTVRRRQSLSIISLGTAPFCMAFPGHNAARYHIGAYTQQAYSYP